jgi:hypothetical protein
MDEQNVRRQEGDKEGKENRKRVKDEKENKETEDE